MTPGAAAAVDAGVWAVWGVLVGYMAAHWPTERFLADGPVTRLRAWEDDGRWWLRTGVRRWKLVVPDLGALVGGTPKRRLAGGPGGLAYMAAETRRAERAHWATALAALAMPLWNPSWLVAVMSAYAVGANAPCIVIQRYNRGRLVRLATRRAARAAVAPAVARGATRGAAA